jgi:DNA invertase Pin-like site-specific DNA recombinase
VSETPDERRARMSAMAKRRLVTMSKAKRYYIAYMAGIQGGAPVRIDHAKVRELRAQGLKYREIAGRLGISIPSVARIMNSKERKRRKRR